VAVRSEMENQSIVEYQLVVGTMTIEHGFYTAG
jgi:hypothetical protein